MSTALSTPAIVTLPCGCFFRGREFVADSSCEEHRDDPDIDDDPEKTEFTFDELDDRAKEKARDAYRYSEHYPHDSWWDSVYEDSDTIARMMGIEIKRRHQPTYGGGIVSGPQIWFSGFSCQGDGACFEGNWSPVRDPLAALSAVMEHAPQDTRLHEIAFDLAHMSERCNALIPDVYVHVEHTGGYSHSGCTRIDVDLPTPDTVDEDNELHLMVWNALCVKHGLVYAPFAEEIRDTLRAFMDWIYRQLEAEHDYLMSDEVVDEYLAELTFDEDGREV